MMGGDLISREAALDVFRNAMVDLRIVGMRSGKTLLQSAVNKAWEGLNKLPAVDAAPAVHGHWINQDSTYTRYQCSVCGERNYGGYESYCPNCGAKMYEETAHE